jgi:predicted Zn finger-like uncharacterized protein
MFTVCPKCALTLVVTAQDLRVAQGYVRCGRCSNVFNAIVGLTDDRGALATNGSGQQGTATTSIIRKAPSIADEPPHDPLSTTGESEAIYAEPDAEDVKFQEVFSEPQPPARSPPPPDTSRPRGPVAFVAPPPGPPVKAPPPAASTTTPSSKTMTDSEKRYSDTEGIETYPESELEFNPDLTDVTKVFVEAAPVAFKNNASTGTFEKIVLRPDESAPASSPAAPVASPPAKPAASAKAAKPAPTPAAAQIPAPPPIAPKPAPAPAPPKPAAPPRRTPDAEDVQIEDDLRSLAARLDATASGPALKNIPLAANDEAAVAGEGADDDDERSIGDIYAKATPRPRPAREVPKPAAPTPARSDIQPATDSGDDDRDIDQEMQAVGVADTLAPRARKRGRFMVWVAGSAVLSLLLVAQVIHQNRHALATKALLNRPLTRFYKAIGVQLVPSWDLRAYDVRQLGASTNDAGQGTLTVRASLKNTAPQPLPLPLLRITMQDRYGNRIASRDVPPTGYVPGAVPPDAHLGVGQRIDAEMTFKDPGQNAVGFEIDACLLTASGRISCANDATAPPR